jgi:hypothetical protein
VCQNIETASAHDEAEPRGLQLCIWLQIWINS